ncbi:hypothetical protein [Shouchella lonarensis]|uniref:Uncharacterized protein n=1 Tax=Shouchella lonarensis TaxID=1464122 RepID=A0A1G6HLN7_9BACI|nr:hypothetical protein [Shouchella lonarensis]SDB95217.1 hypothetical protein SAMN05421737_10468 [Shouchella lonarensis]
MEAWRLCPDAKRTEYEVVTYEDTTLETKKELIQLPADGELGWLFVTDGVMLYYNKRALYSDLLPDNPDQPPTISTDALRPFLAICGPVIFVGFDEKGNEVGLSQDHFDAIIKHIPGQIAIESLGRSVPYFSMEEREISEDEIMENDKEFLL